MTATAQVTVGTQNASIRAAIKRVSRQRFDPAWVGRYDDHDRLRGPESPTKALARSNVRRLELGIAVDYAVP